jgi:hypothetical protein
MNRLSLAYLPALSRLLFPLFFTFIFLLQCKKPNGYREGCRRRGKPIAPVSVVVKGTTTGTTTNAAGNSVFRSLRMRFWFLVLLALAPGSDCFGPHYRRCDPGKSNTKSLDEVVVTALGIGKAIQGSGLFYYQCKTR